jgi:hypothetical protein
MRILLFSFSAMLACSSPGEATPVSVPVSVPISAAASAKASPTPAAKPPTTSPVAPAPQLTEGCVGGPYPLNMLLSKKTCPIKDDIAALLDSKALTVTTDPSPLKVQSGKKVTFQLSLTNNTKANVHLELALHCSEQEDEIFLRAMKIGTEDFADLEVQPKSAGCAISWGCATRNRDARIGLTPGGEARIELTYKAVYRVSHCDPGPATKKPLPPGQYELMVSLPIPTTDGGLWVGRVPLTVTK